MKKKLIKMLFAFALVLSCLPVLSVHAETSDVKRYTVLVLDTSSTSDFLNNGSVFYTAGTAIEYVKTAAKKFVENVQNADGTNYLAIVSYKGSSATVVSNFSDNSNALNSAIDGLSASETTRSVGAGLQSADNLISSVTEAGAIKNVVLFTTGMTNAGDYSYEGLYGEETVGSRWRRQDTDVRLYAYANHAISVAEQIKTKANLYTIGLFQTMNDMPEEGADVVEFFKLFAHDCATSPAYFYDVANPEDLEFIFGQVAEDLSDSDADGIPDSWESEGVTVNGQFVDLPSMGADPEVPDVFVEIDWMVKPSKSFLFWETSPETSLAPSENAMRIVYQQFKAHGINLHIDAGPDSTDFVTGKKWGSLSGGNEIPYEKHFAVKSDNYAHWDSTVKSNFGGSRVPVFRHCLFVDQYDNTSSSGIAFTPGQYLIIANQNWVRNTGDVGVAGTFMHELGHNLGLDHGGTDGDNNKPNYLSIMNYLFQTSGLVGTNEVNYSEYKLPDLDENSLDEGRGLDPNGLTAGTGLGSKFTRKILFEEKEHTVCPIAYQSVDYSRWWGIDSSNVSVDINGDGHKTVLISSEDWSNLNFKGGELGEEYAFIAGVDIPDDEEQQSLNEAELEEFIESGSLGNEGAGALDFVSPVTVIADTPGQNLYIRVSNLTDRETTYHLNVEAGGIVKGYSSDITVDGSLDSIEYVDIAVPYVSYPAEGRYSITATLSYPGREDVVKTYNVSVYKPSAEEAEELRDGLENGELDEELPEEVVEEYIEVLDPERIYFNEIEYTVKVGSELNLSRELMNTNASAGNIYWDVDDTSIASVSSGKIKGKKAGITEVFAETAEGRTAIALVRVVFTDVPASGKYYSDAVYWAVTAGITNGYTDKDGYARTFKPENNCTREAVVTFLWRLAGRPEPESLTSKFKDVQDPSKYYYKPILWAAEQGITKGYSDGTFKPDATCLREHVVTFLWRYAEMPEPTVTVNPFNDVKTSDYYYKASLWANENGIAKGYSSGQYAGGFGPKLDCLREHVVTFLYRYAK